MAKLIVKLKDKILEEVRLNKINTSIGRDEKNDIHLKNPSVSRVHAKVIKGDKLYYVEDQKSTNGTYVNDELVMWRKGLYDDDRIVVGKYTLVFKDTVQEKKPEPEKLMPEFLDSTIKVPKKRGD
jgi:pSer/pThr/pTyr-binding forkhead associated (FHA) protein